MAYNQLLLLRELDRLLADRPAITLNEIATRTGVGRHTLATLVRRHRGVSFRDYREILLVSEACRLLAQPALSVKEVAISLGYRHPRDFSRFFRQAKGATPQGYRDSLVGREPSGKGSELVNRV